MTERIPASLFSDLHRKARPGKRVARELPVHREVLRFLRAELPPGTVVMHAPGGGDLGGGAAAHRAAAKARSMGYSDGTPDLFWVGWDGVLHCVEVKAPGGAVGGSKGYLSRDEREVKDLLVWAGARYGVVRSVDDARVLLDAWGFTR